MGSQGSALPGNSQHPSDMDAMGHPNGFEFGASTICSLGVPVRPAHVHRPSVLPAFVALAAGVVAVVVDSVEGRICERRFLSKVSLERFLGISPTFTDTNASAPVVRVGRAVWVSRALKDGSASLVHRGDSAAYRCTVGCAGSDGAVPLKASAALGGSVRQVPCGDSVGLTTGAPEQPLPITDTGWAHLGTCLFKDRSTPKSFPGQVHACSEFPFSPQAVAAASRQPLPKVGARGFKPTTTLADAVVVDAGLAGQLPAHASLALDEGQPELSSDHFDSSHGDVAVSHVTKNEIA